jgi:hypothetical protein
MDMPEPWGAVERLAAKHGLRMTIRDRGGLFEVFLDRSSDLGGWSAPRTRIAAGPDAETTAQQALAALAELDQPH